MKVKFDEKTIWQSKIENQRSLFLAGTVFIDKDRLTIDELFVFLNEISTIEDFQKLIQKFKGQYSFIFENNTFLVAFTDKIRSFPITLYKLNNQHVVSNSNRHFNLHKELFSINTEAIKTFRASGYTIGEDTLYEELEVLQPGHFVYFDKMAKKLSKENYYSFFDEESKKYSEQQVLKKIDEVITASIERLIQVADGKKIVIPLSAGLDSRLILGKLIELGYTNILTFTYGPKNIWERDIAKKCAEYLNIAWYFVELNKEVKNRFHLQDRKEYYQIACNHLSVPHIADYYALNILKEKNILNFEDVIIVNGQSGDFIAGAHIPDDINDVSLNSLYDRIINKYFALWKDQLTSDFRSLIIEKLNKNYKFEDYLSNEKLLFKEYERFECDERQIKYVINGQRAYDWLNIDWYLPLWSDEMLDFWRSIDIKHKLKQKAYKDYCRVYNPGKVFDIETTDKRISLPLHFYPFLVLFKIISKLNSKVKYGDLKRTYLSFYEKYFPFYPQKKYFQYLKDAKYHRNPVSYWVKTYLKENNL